MQIDEFIERPKADQAPAAAAPAAQAAPSPASQRPATEIEADLAELEQRRVAAIARVEELEAKAAGGYRDYLAGAGDADMESSIAAADREARGLSKKVAACRADLEAARNREKLAAALAWRGEFEALVKRRTALAEKVEADLAAMCAGLRAISGLQRDMLRAMTEGKRMVPQEQRRAVLVAEAAMVLADPTMIAAWVARAARVNGCELAPGDEDSMRMPFAASIETTGAQALAEMDYILNIGELAG